MTLKKHIDDIRECLEKGELLPDEAAVSKDIVCRLVDKLGWSIYESKYVCPQFKLEGGKVDFALCYPPLEPRVFIEVKKLGGIEGPDAEEQLFRYAFRRGVPIAILTDGQKWQFFHPIGEGPWEKRKVCELDLITKDSQENAERLNRYLNYKAVQTGEAIRAIRADYQHRQVKTRLPEAWIKLVEEADELLLRAVAEKTESLCGYRPTDEQVLDFLKDLERKTDAPIPPKPNEDKEKQRGRLVVIMSNGDQIDNPVSATTFVKVIEKLGVERVRGINKEYIIRLISTGKPSPKRTHRQSGQYYIITNNSTPEKKRFLEEIAKDLGEALKVDILYSDV